MKIELLYFDDGPNRQVAAERLDEIANRRRHRDGGPADLASPAESVKAASR